MYPAHPREARESEIVRSVFWVRPATNAEPLNMAVAVQNIATARQRNFRNIMCLGFWNGFEQTTRKPSRMLGEEAVPPRGLVGLLPVLH